MTVDFEENQDEQSSKVYSPSSLRRKSRKSILKRASIQSPTESLSLKLSDGEESEIKFNKNSPRKKSKVPFVQKPKSK